MTAFSEECFVVCVIEVVYNINLLLLLLLLLLFILYTSIGFNNNIYKPRNCVLEIFTFFKFKTKFVNIFMLPDVIQYVRNIHHLISSYQTTIIDMVPLISNHLT